MGTLTLRNRRATFPVIAGIAGLLFSSLAAAEVFRCEDGGRVVYSDRPCAGKGTTLKIAAEVSVSASARAVETRAGDAANRIVAGMTSLQVLRIEGMPAERTRKKNSQGIREAWTYCRDDVYVDVELQDGVVVAVSRRATAARSTSASVGTRSPTAPQASSTLNAATFVESRKSPDGTSVSP